MQQQCVSSNFIRGACTNDGLFVNGFANAAGSNVNFSAPQLISSMITGGSSGLTLNAGGINQNITLTPSGTGFTLLNSNLGIGTTNPAAPITVNTNSIPYPDSTIMPQSPQAIFNGHILTNNVLRDGTQIYIGGGATDTDHASNFLAFAGVGIGHNIIGTADTSSFLTFNTSTDNVFFERMRIDKNGNVGIGLTPSANGQLQVAKSIVAGVSTVTFSATPTFDASLGNTQKITLTANVTSSMLSNCAAGEFLVFDIIQSATGGFTFLWPTNVLNAGTIGVTASKHNIQAFYCDGTNARATGAMLTNQN